jgi:hypothetical protein
MAVAVGLTVPADIWAAIFMLRASIAGVPLGPLARIA